MNLAWPNILIKNSGFNDQTMTRFYEFFSTCKINFSTFFHIFFFFFFKELLFIRLSCQVNAANFFWPITYSCRHIFFEFNRNSVQRKTPIINLLISTLFLFRLESIVATNFTTFIPIWLLDPCGNTFAVCSNAGLIMKTVVSKIRKSTSTGIF